MGSPKTKTSAEGPRRPRPVPFDSAHHVLKKKQKPQEKKGKKTSTRQKLRSNVTAESVLRANAARLNWSSHDLAPKKPKNKGMGVSSLNSGNDLSFIEQVFATNATKATGCKDPGLACALSAMEKVGRSAPGGASQFHCSKNVKKGQNNNHDDKDDELSDDAMILEAVNNPRALIKPKTTQRVAAGSAKTMTPGKTSSLPTSSAVPRTPKINPQPVMSRKREKRKALERKRAEATLKKQTEAAERLADTRALGMRETIAFGDVVDRPPLGLGSIMRKQVLRLRHKQEISGEHEPSEVPQCLSVLPDSHVNKLLARKGVTTKGNTDGAKASDTADSVQQLSQAAQHAYAALRRKRMEQAAVARHTQGNSRKNAQQRVIQRVDDASSLSFPASCLYSKKTGQSQWRGQGTLFSLGC